MKRTPSPKSANPATPPPNKAAASPSKSIKAKAGTPVKRSRTEHPLAEGTEPVCTPPAQSKQAQLIALLRTPNGASMAQLTALTGWQAHTVRGMISGTLRKQMGLSVTLETVDGTRLYRIAGASA